MIKAFAFDLDGTLTQHKTPLDDTNRRVLEKLAKSYTLLMVGAGNCMRIHNQLGKFPMDIIGNYGMQYAEYKDGELRLVRNDVIECKDKEYVEKTAHKFRNKYGFTEFSGNNIEYHASGCLTFPILGTLAKQEDKLKFDPERKKRRAIYSEVCEAFSDYNVFVGGSSSFDMAPKPFNKYYALDLWCREKGFSHSEVVFVGDDYGLGGNDESVYRSDFRFITIDDYRRLCEVLSPWLRDDAEDVDGLLGEKRCWACNKIHTCDIKKVVIRHGALNELSALAGDYSNITLVCDENTYRVCGARAEELLFDKVSNLLIYKGEGFVVPNEDAIEKLSACVNAKTDLIVGVGSGVINDLCKYVSFERKLPYFIIATAPSMDGYASKGCAMILGGMKVTTNGNVPRVIIADTSIIKDAPLDMLKAGYGDIIGKYSCLNDWRLSVFVNGESFCKEIYDMTYKTVESISKKAKDILTRDEGAIAELMRGLIIVGIAMAYMGNSRPASGSEHHLSHYFEIVGLLRGEDYFCHGTDVAYSTYITSLIRSELLALDSPKKSKFDIDAWESEIRRVYSGRDGDSTAEGIIAMQKKLGWIYEDKFEIYSHGWGDIKKILADSPTPSEVFKMLCDIELPIEDFENMYSKEKRDDAIIYAKYLKDRYSVLWLYSEIER